MREGFANVTQRAKPWLASQIARYVHYPDREEEEEENEYDMLVVLVFLLVLQVMLSTLF